MSSSGRAVVADEEDGETSVADIRVNSADLGGLAFEQRDATEFRPAQLANKSFFQLVANTSVPSVVAPPPAGATETRRAAAAVAWSLGMPRVTRRATVDGVSADEEKPRAPNRRASSGAHLSSPLPSVLTSAGHSIGQHVVVEHEDDGASDADAALAFMYNVGDKVQEGEEKPSDAEASTHVDGAAPAVASRLSSELHTALLAAALRRSSGRYFSSPSANGAGSRGAAMAGIGLAGRNIVTAGIGVRGLTSGLASGNPHENDSGSSSLLPSPPTPYRAVRCYTCKKMGHLSIDCPFKKMLEPCYLCGQGGHSSSWCKANDCCFICDTPGHMAAACPNKDDMTAAARRCEGVPPHYGYRLLMTIGPHASGGTRWARTRQTVEERRQAAGEAQQHHAGGGSRARHNEIVQRVPPLPDAQVLMEQFCCLCSGPHSSEACYEINRIQNELSLVHCAVCGQRGHASCNTNILHYEALARSVKPTRETNAMPWESALSTVAKSIYKPAPVRMGDSEDAHPDPLLQLFGRAHPELIRAHREPTSDHGTCFNCGQAGHTGATCGKQKSTALMFDSNMASTYSQGWAHPREEERYDSYGRGGGRQSRDAYQSRDTYNNNQYRDTWRDGSAHFGRSNEYEGGGRSHSAGPAFNHRRGEVPPSNATPAYNRHHAAAPPSGHASTHSYGSGNRHNDTPTTSHRRGEGTQHRGVEEVEHGIDSLKSQAATVRIVESTSKPVDPVAAVKGLPSFQARQWDDIPTPTPKSAPAHTTGKSPEVYVISDDDDKGTGGAGKEPARKRQRKHSKTNGSTDTRQADTPLPTSAKRFVIHNTPLPTSSPASSAQGKGAVSLAVGQKRGRSPAPASTSATPLAAATDASVPVKSYYERNPDAAAERDKLMSDPSLGKEAVRSLLQQIRKKVKKQEKRARSAHP
jgi:hypothetical protein